MHLTVQSRQSMTTFCAEKAFHYLLVEFNCDEKEIDENIRETAHFYQNFDKQMNWTYICTEKLKKYTPIFESCTKNAEGPLITVHNSENPAIHSVTARGVQGALQTSILGVLSSPVIKNHLYYFSRHGESEYNVLGRIGGDADLSSRGKCYADRLTKYFATTKDVVKPKMVRNNFYFKNTFFFFAFRDSLLTIFIFFFFVINLNRFGHQSCAEPFIQQLIFRVFMHQSRTSTKSMP